jgi:hypothetical protein
VVPCGGIAMLTQWMRLFRIAIAIAIGIEIEIDSDSDLDFVHLAN